MIPARAIMLALLLLPAPALADGSTIFPDSHYYDRYRAEARAGDARAQFIWGLLLERGVHGQPDPVAAAQWYERAADQGHADARYKLGQLYQQGRGVPQDLARAAQYYRAVAEQGQAEAQYSLAYLYETGEGVPHDIAQAVDLYRAAAGQKVALAMRNLGLLYAAGPAPIQQDEVRAWFWLTLAAEHGDMQAQALRDQVAAHLDGDAQMRAQAMLKDWRGGGG